MVSYEQFQQGIMLVLQGICWILAFMTAFTKNLTRKRKVSIILLEICSAMLLISDLVFYTYEGLPGVFAGVATRLSKFSIHLFTNFILFSFNLYLMSLFSQEGSIKSLKRLRFVECLVALGLILVIVSQFTGLYSDSAFYPYSGICSACSVCNSRSSFRRYVYCCYGDRSLCIYNSGNERSCRTGTQT